MTEFSFDGHGAILRVTALTVGPTKYAHISAGDAEKPYKMRQRCTHITLKGIGGIRNSGTKKNVDEK